MHGRGSRLFGGLRVVCFGVLGLASLQLGAPQALAQGSRLGPTFPIPGIPTPDKRFPDVAFDPRNGVYLMVHGRGAVGGAFVSGDGIPVGAPFQIGAEGQAPRVAYSPDPGGFLVTWLDYTPPAGVRGRIIRYSGGAPIFVTGVFLISATQGGAHSESPPAVAYATGSREFLVAWMQFGVPGQQWDIRAQRVRNDGVLLGGEIAITADMQWQTKPAVGYNTQLDDFFVTYDFAPSFSSIVGQRVRAGSGALVGGPTEVYRGSFETFSEVAFNASRGQYLVTWYHIGGSGQGNMYGRFVGGDGSIIGSVIPITTFPPWTGDANGTNFNTVSGTFFVVFHSISHEVFGVQVSGDGVPGVVMQVTETTGTGNFNPRLAASVTRAEWLVVAANSFATIVGQRIQSGGGGSPSYTLTVSRSGTGDGTVTGPNINCGTMCSATFPAGTQVVLTATPAAGSVFGGWTGDPDCLDGSLTMDGPRACGARFNRPAPVNRRTIDLNGDGLGDVFLYSRTTGQWLMMYNNGAGGFTHAGRELRWARDWDIKAARLNDDPYMDLFLYRPSTGEWFQALNTGTGDFTYHRPGPIWNPGWQTYVARLNGDAIDDIFLYNPSTGQAVQCLSNGAGGFERLVGFQWNRGWTVRVARLNADLLDDIFVYNVATGQWTRAVNTGTGDFSYGPGGNWAPQFAIHFGDFTGDGLDDVFLYYTAGGVWFLGRNTGVDFVLTRDVWNARWEIYVADLNGDQYEDLFIYTRDNGQWFQCLSTGTGNFIYRTVTPAGWWDPSERWQIFVTQLNGDALDDIFVYSAVTGHWFQCFNDGAGGFTYSHPRGQWNPGWTVVGSR